MNATNLFRWATAASAGLAGLAMVLEPFAIFNPSIKLWAAAAAGLGYACKTFAQAMQEKA